MELDGVFMDLYGTITAGDRAAVESTCEEIVKDTGAQLTAHQLSIVWGERFFHALDFHNGDEFITLFELEQRTLIDTMRELGVEVDPVPYARMLLEYWRNPPLQPEIKTFFKAFPLPVYVVSNADQADAEAALDSHGIEVRGVLTSEAARSYKPDRAIFDMALGQTGWRRDRVIHVGDSLHSDVGGAIVAGIRNGWLNRAHRIHDVGTHEPDHEFADLMEFSDWVRAQSA